MKILIKNLTWSKGLIMISTVEQLIKTAKYLGFTAANGGPHLWLLTLFDQNIASSSLDKHICF